MLKRVLKSFISRNAGWACACQLLVTNPMEMVRFVYKWRRHLVSFTPGLTPPSTNNDRRFRDLGFPGVYPRCLSAPASRCSVQCHVFPSSAIRIFSLSNKRYSKSGILRFAVGRNAAADMPPYWRLPRTLLKLIPKSTPRPGGKPCTQGIRCART
jgi:hypothetical protein